MNATPAIADDLIVIGKIYSVHGVRGEVKVYSFTDPIKNLLDYSRIGNKKELEEVDCNKILHNAIADLGTAICPVWQGKGRLPAVSPFQSPIRGEGGRGVGVRRTPGPVLAVPRSVVREPTAA